MDGQLTKKQTRFCLSDGVALLSANSVADIRGRVYMGMLTVRSAEEKDVPVVLSLIRALASYEKLSHEVTATEGASVMGYLVGKGGDCVAGRMGGEAVGFALFFRNFSTFVGNPLYLEDLFVKPTAAGASGGPCCRRSPESRSTRGMPGWIGRC